MAKSAGLMEVVNRVIVSAVSHAARRVSWASPDARVLPVPADQTADAARTAWTVSRVPMVTQVPRVNVAHAAFQVYRDLLENQVPMECHQWTDMMVSPEIKVQLVMMDSVVIQVFLVFPALRVPVDSRVNVVILVPKVKRVNPVLRVM
jgi:hypothetical protein